jgi:hypothetical protein
MKLSPRLTNYFLWNSTDFFKTAEQFNILTEKFLSPSLVVWFDMIGNPLIMLAIALYTKKLPSIISALGILKTIQVWCEWYEYRCVKEQLIDWKEIVLASGGPQISTNDTNYMSYVYADGIQRLFNNQMRLPVHPSRSKTQTSRSPPL